MWIYSTWVFNRLNPDNTLVRLLLFCMMLGGLFLSMAIPQAFGDRGIIFALAFVAMQVGRSAFVTWATQGQPVLRNTYQRITLWLAFTYLHIPIVAGVVLGAVGSELTIAHPGHHATLVEAAVIIGAVALFLLGNGLFKWVSAPNFPSSHMIGIGLCALTMVFAGFFSLVVLNSIAALILVVVAVWERRSFAAGPVAR